MKNTPRYYITTAMLAKHGACVGSRIAFNQLFGSNREVELTDPAVVKKLLESGSFRYRLDWPVRRLYNELPVETKLERQAGKIATQLYDLGYSYETATSEAGRKAVVEKATKLLRKTGQLWDRYREGER